MMTSEEKRRLWLDAYHAEMRSMMKHLDSGEVNIEDMADGCREWADIVVKHTANRMPDFAEPQPEFDRDKAAESVRLAIYSYGGITNSDSRLIADAIVKGKIPGVKYTPPTTTNPG